jgi:hypothetical protein
MDVQQSNYNAFTGNRQGLYIMGRSADFDLYIYRDAYTPILAECYANQYGTTRTYTTQGYILDNIHVNDWAMYAGVEFGNAEYDKTPDSLKIVASSTTGGSVEVWLDSLETGDKIAECLISNTGSSKTFQTFTSTVESVSGRHDVYLKFTGTGTGKLFQLQWLYFTAKGDTITMGAKSSDSPIPQSYGLEQNFPNPFNPSTIINYALPASGFVTLRVFDMLGREVAILVNEQKSAGKYSLRFDGRSFSSGVYFYWLQADKFIETKKLVLLR